MGSPASWAGGLSNQSGTVTGAANAETLNAQTGVVTTESLNTAAGAVNTRTLTNSYITANSLVFVQIVGGTNTKYPIMVQSVVPAAGSATIKFMNNNAAALDGTLIYAFLIL